MKISEQRSTEMQLLADRLQDQRTAMVTLRDARGWLSARPLTPLEMDRDGVLWILVSKQSMGALFAHGAQPANVAFSDEDKSLFVSIAGQARLVDDAERKAALWTVMARPWFSGADDPDLTALAITPDEAEVWDGPDSSVVRVLAMAASVAAAKPIGLGDHEVVVPPVPPFPVPHQQPA